MELILIILFEKNIPKRIIYAKQLCKFQIIIFLNNLISTGLFNDHGLIFHENKGI